MSQRWRPSVWCIALSTLVSVAAQAPPVLNYASPPNFLKLSGTNPEEFTANDVSAGIQIYPFRPITGNLQVDWQRTLDEEGIAIELAMRVLAIERVGGIQNAQLEKLARVVPLVQRVADVEAFIALEANQIGAERGRRCAGKRGFADAGLALQIQRPLQTERQKQ